jgi:nucleoside 2-deoxyribosyltransferase
VSRRIYLASPTGFSPEHTPYRKKVVKKLASMGFDVIDPWSVDWRPDIAQARTNAAVFGVVAYRPVALKIGALNARGIDDCNALVAILDGTEPDSGTVAELGYAAGLGKACYGLRTDLRDVGDLPGLPINLQVQYFIEKSGGCLVRSIKGLDVIDIIR